MSDGPPGARAGGSICGDVFAASWQKREELKRRGSSRSSHGAAARRLAAGARRLAPIPPVHSVFGVTEQLTTHTDTDTTLPEASILFQTGSCTSVPAGGVWGRPSSGQD